MTFKSATNLIYPYIKIYHIVYYGATRTYGSMLHNANFSGKQKIHKEIDTRMMHNHTSYIMHA